MRRRRMQPTLQMLVTKRPRQHTGSLAGTGTPPPLHSPRMMERCVGSAPLHFQRSVLSFDDEDLKSGRNLSKTARSDLISSTDRDVDILLSAATGNIVLIMLSLFLALCIQAKFWTIARWLAKFYKACARMS